MSILGSIATAAAVTLIPGAGVALAVWHFGKDAVVGSLRAAASWLFLHPMALVAIAALIFAWIEYGKVGRRDTVIAGQNVLIGKVTTEVDRGINAKSKPADAPFYIHRFVDNVRTLDAALTRQSKALEVAKADANAHVDAAHEAAKPTQAQGEREKVRQKIADPARTSGLTADEWSQL